jgi:hypothetical protein
VASDALIDADGTITPWAATTSLGTIVSVRGTARGKGELDPRGMLNPGVLIDPKVDELAHDIEALMLPW